MDLQSSEQADFESLALMFWITRTASKIFHITKTLNDINQTSQPPIRFFIFWRSDFIIILSGQVGDTVKNYCKTCLQRLGALDQITHHGDVTQTHSHLHTNYKMQNSELNPAIWIYLTLFQTVHQAIHFQLQYVEIQSSILIESIQGPNMTSSIKFSVT